MGLFKRYPVRTASALVTLLAVSEGWIAWHYLRSTPAGDPATRVASLEAELQDKTGELNRLIFLRDAETRRRAQALTNHADPGSLRSAEQELAEAAANAYIPVPATEGRSASSERTHEIKNSQKSEEDRVEAPQGAAPSILDVENVGDLPHADGAETAAALTPSDIDPKHLVTMANIMTGRKIAELTQMRGQQVIRYSASRISEDAPLWHLLDAVTQANALIEVTLVGNKTQDGDRLRKLSERLNTTGGIPSRMIRVKAGDIEYRGLEGILITLRRKS